MYELAPGGAFTLDPAVDYYTVGDEPNTNVYQTLITFNGTQAGPNYQNWTPQLATCVPGSPQCSAQFGSTLVYDNATTGSPQYYTFEIDAHAQFYDPATGAHWGVYPSDVMFSLSRTMSFANLPFLEFYNGWIQAQWATPAGNPSWDGGIHSPYNNTPNHVLAAMLVNDSTYCPTSATVATNGCITFDVGQSGLAWPYFLELISDPLGASVTPCGVFTYLGAGLPGFLGTPVKDGDGPCLLPGNATSTTQTAFQNYVKTVNPEAWDAVQELGIPAPPSPQPAVQWDEIGSGPYAQVTGSASNSGGVGMSGGYTLEANPYYVQPVGCAGSPECEPAPGHYIPNVVVVWQSTDSYGLEEAIAGQADTVGYDETDTSTILQLVKSGTYGLLRNVVDSAANWFMAFELGVSATNEHAIDPYTYFNVPQDFLAQSSLRTFLTLAYPYATIENHVWTVDGVSFGAYYGGAIPVGQASYYPHNITWPYLVNGGVPTTNPSTVGGAAWWWAQANNASNATTYDPELTSCTTGSPCAWPIVGWTGTPSLDAAIADWIAEIKSLSGGRLAPYSYDIPGTTLETEVAYGNGNGSVPVYNWGWIQDYADPTDWFLPMWQANGTFSYAMGTYWLGTDPEFNSASCGHDDLPVVGTAFTADQWNDLVYWANQPNGALATDCEGVAWDVMTAWINWGAHISDLSERVLVYNEVEHIGNELSLMVYAYLFTANIDYGSWLSPTGINVNPSVGAGGVQTWYTWTYATNVYDVNFTETGFTPSAGHPWSVTLHGVTESNSTSTTIVFAGQANGTYPFTVGFIAGYTATPANGTVVVSGAKVSTSITFAGIVGPTYPLVFTEGGLLSNTTWTITVVDVGAISSQQPTVTFDLAAGTYGYSPGLVIGYVPPANGSATLASPGLNVSVSYVGVILTTYSVTFASTGLPSGQSWTVDLNGFSLTSTAANITFYEENGTYTFTLTVPATVVPPAGSGQVAVVAANVVVDVPLAAASASFAVTFTESGLPTGSAWNVTIDGFGQLSKTTSIAFSLPNGTYPWTTSTIGGWTSATLSGAVTVNGSAASVAIKFVPFTYAVTFFEGGLPTGTSWSVTVDGVTTPSTTYYLTVDLPNGTFPFTVGSVTGYIATPSSGNVTVSAAPTTAVIIFSGIPATYTVTFTESGLPSGTSWTVYFNGHSQSSAGTSIAFSVVNGSWTFAVTSSGYTASPSGGSVTVSGTAQGVSITFTAVKTATSGINSTTGLSTLAYALIGVLALLAVIFLALALRRRQPPSTPPQTWSGTTSQGAPPSSGGSMGGGSMGGSTGGGMPPSPPPSS